METGSDICDSCITAAGDEGARGIEREVCVSYGADIADHLCESTEDPSTRCACACRRGRR